MCTPYHNFPSVKNTIKTIAVLPRVVLRIKAIIYTKNLELFLAHSKYLRSFYNLQLEELIIFLLTQHKNVRETKVVTAMWNLRILTLSRIHLKRPLIRTVEKKYRET